MPLFIVSHSLCLSSRVSFSLVLPNPLFSSSFVVYVFVFFQSLILPRSSIPILLPLFLSLSSLYVYITFFLQIKLPSLFCDPFLSFSFLCVLTQFLHFPSYSLFIRPSFRLVLPCLSLKPRKLRRCKMAAHVDSAMRSSFFCFLRKWRLFGVCPISPLSPPPPTHPPLPFPLPLPPSPFEACSIRKPYIIIIMVGLKKTSSFIVPLPSSTVSIFAW